MKFWVLWPQLPACTNGCGPRLLRHRSGSCWHLTHSVSLPSRDRLRACLGPAGPRGTCPPPCCGRSENTVEGTALQSTELGAPVGPPLFPMGTFRGTQDLCPSGTPVLGLGPCPQPWSKVPVGVPLRAHHPLGQRPPGLADVGSLSRLSWGKILGWQLIKDFN